MFMNIEVNIVIVTSDPVPFANLRSVAATIPSIPVDSSTPPNVRAQIIRDTVHIIDCIPPRVRRSPIMISAADAPSDITNSYPLFDELRTSPKLTPWNAIPKNAPRITPPISPGIAGTLNTTISITATGGISISMLMLKFA